MQLTVSSATPSAFAKAVLLSPAADPRLGCSTTIQSFPHGHHVRTEYGVDAGLVPGSLVLEPCEDVPINPKRDWLLRRRVHDDRLGPEISWEVGKFRGGSTANLTLGHSAELREVCVPANGFLRFDWSLRHTLGAHGDHSDGPK